MPGRDVASLKGLLEATLHGPDVPATLALFPPSRAVIRTVDDLRLLNSSERNRLRAAIRQGESSGATTGVATVHTSPSPALVQEMAATVAMKRAQNGTRGGARRLGQLSSLAAELATRQPAMMTQPI